MLISFDILQTVGIVVIVFLVGRYIKNRVKFFQKYFIPASVIGGLLFSLLVFLGVKTNIFTIELTNTLQEFFMNIFFTCTGFTCSIKILKKSGKLGFILAIVAVAFLFVQNIVGVLLAGLFGINKLLGIAMGSISMSGGVGSGAAFGPMLEKFGAEGGTTVGVAAATFGLLLGSIVGGPVVRKPIIKYKLKSNSNQIEENKEEKIYLNSKSIFNSVLIVIVAALLGTYISKLLNLTKITFPYYVGCLFGGAIIRNIADLKYLKISMVEIDIIGEIALNLFLSMALMTLNISKLMSLAVPMLVILVMQALVMVVWAYYITFVAMGKNYDAAVMAAGHCGVGLGQTPNAMANMSAIIEENGPAPTAWFVLPVITVIFINICNPLVITFFINLFK